MRRQGSSGLGVTTKFSAPPYLVASTSRNFAGRDVRPFASIECSNVPRNTAAPLDGPADPLRSTSYHFFPPTSQSTNTREPLGAAPGPKTYTCVQIYVGL